MKKHDLPTGFTLTYHAGFSDTRANSIESIERAVAEDAQIIEMDVTFRDDGTPVIVHAGSAGKSGGELLSEALAAVCKSAAMCVNLDLKSVDNVGAVDALVKSLGLESRAFYTGVGDEWAPVVSRDSTLPYYLNTGVSRKEKKGGKNALTLIEKLKNAGAVGLNAHFSNASAPLNEALRESGLLASYWTPSTKHRIKKTLRTVPDNITTRAPSLAKEIIENIKDG